MERAKQGNTHRILLRRKGLGEGNILETLQFRKVRFPYNMFGCPDVRVWTPSLVTQS
jgi:hypothetical protein